MSLKQQLIDALPPYTGDENVLIKKKQGTTDIVLEICEAHQFFTADYDKIYKFFDTGNIYNTCKKIFEFEKNNLDYYAESDENQSSKSPTVILHTNADCKHYALFTSGILESIQENDNVTWDWFYRFASDKDVNNVTHVFIVVVDRGEEIWIDPCLSRFDQRKSYFLIKDKKPMSLYRRISGVSEIVPTPQKTVTVSKQKAFTSFLIMLQENMFAQKPGGVSMVKTLMKNNPAITNGPVKQYFLNNGFDWDKVQQFINS